MSVLDRVERISIEVSDRCSKACAFCYNASDPRGRFAWDPDALVAFVVDGAAHGIRAVSFGGGEPLEYAPMFDVLERTRGVLFRSLTTNGLLLDDAMVARLARAGVDKVHVSIHFPKRAREVSRVIDQVRALERAGVRSGVNLLVARSEIDAAKAAAHALHDAGIGNDRIVFLPMRGDDTPTPAEVAAVAGGRFQSMTCLAACAKSARFCSIGADASVAWCSYTKTRRRLASPTYAALVASLDGLGLDFCGGNDGLVRLDRLSRRALDGHGVVRGGP